MSQMEKEGFGEEFSICSSFCFGGIRGGQKTENTISILCLYHFTIFRPRSKGVHPRHSPRTFPLGLLAPKCLGFLLILAIPALRSGGEGRRLFGGRKESLPPASVSSSQWFVRVFSALHRLWSFNALWLRLTCLRSPPSHNPLPRFHIGCMWCRFRFGFLYCKIT